MARTALVQEHVSRVATVSNVQPEPLIMMQSEAFKRLADQLGVLYKPDHLFPVGVWELWDEDCRIQRELFVVFKKMVNSFSYFIEVMQREPLNLPTDHSCENREQGNGWLRENKKNCMGSTMSEKSHWYNLLRWVSGFTAAEIHHMYVSISSELAHRKFGVGMFQIRHKWRFKLIQIVSDLVLWILKAAMFDRREHVSWLNEDYRSRLWMWINGTHVVSRLRKWLLQKFQVQEQSSLFLFHKATTKVSIFFVDTMWCLRNRIWHWKLCKGRKCTFIMSSWMRVMIQVKTRELGFVGFEENKSGVDAQPEIQTMSELLHHWNSNRDALLREELQVKHKWRSKILRFGREKYKKLSSVKGDHLYMIGLRLFKFQQSFCGARGMLRRLSERLCRAQKVCCYKE